MASVGSDVGKSLAIAERDGIPLDAIAASDLLWRSARKACLPKMTAIDIATIGVEEDGFAVWRERPLLDFAVARREELRRRAGLRIHRVEMLPAVLLAGDDEPIRRGPVERAATCAVRHRGEGLVGLVATLPDFARGAVACIRDPHRPRMRPVRFEKESCRSVALLRGAANEGDALAVRRPPGRGITIDGRRDVTNGFCSGRINGDEGVIAAIGDKCEA